MECAPGNECFVHRNWALLNICRITVTRSSAEFNLLYFGLILFELWSRPLILSKSLKDQILEVIVHLIRHIVRAFHMNLPTYEMAFRSTTQCIKIYLLDFGVRATCRQRRYRKGQSHYVGELYTLISAYSGLCASICLSRTKNSRSMYQWNIQATKLREFGTCPL